MHHAALRRLYCTLFTLSLLFVFSLPIFGQSTYPTITVKNATQLEEVARLGYGKDIWDFAFAPDGSGIAYAATEGVLLGSNELTEIPRWIRSEPAPVNGFSTLELVSEVGFSPRGDLVYAAGSTIYVVDPESGEVTAVLEHEQAQNVTSFAFHPTLPLIAVGTFEDGAVWNYESGIQVATLDHDGSPVNDLAYNGRGELLTGGRGLLVLWRDNQPVARMAEITRSVNEVAWNPTNDDQFAYGEGDTSNMVRVEGNLLSGTDRFEEQFGIENETVTAINFSNGGEYIAEGWSNGMVFIRNTSDGEVVHQLQGNATIFEVEFTADDTQLVALDGDGVMYGWDVESGEAIFDYPMANGAFTAVASSPSGRYVVGTGEFGRISVFDLTTMEEAVRANDGRLNHAVAYSMDNTYIATGGEGDFSVHVWNLNEGRRTWVLNGHEAAIRSVAFSPNTQLLISGGDDETVRAWNMETGESIYTISGFDAAINSVIVAPNNLTLLVGAADGSSYIYQADNGEQLATIDIPMNGIESINVNNDMTQFALANMTDWSIRPITPDTPPDPLTGFNATSGRRSVFNPDSSLFAYVPNVLPYLVLVDLVDQPGATLEELYSESNGALFTTDGSLLISASPNGTLRVYGVK